MNPSARVGSLDALKALYTAMLRFGPDAQEALGAAEMEIRRILDSLHECLKHWQRQVEKRQEDVNRARADLTYARAVRQGQRSGYVEQEIALQKALARLREAEEKVVVAKRWLLHLPQAIDEYQGPARRLAGMLDADFKQGIVLLENKIALLEAYAEVHVSEPPPALGGSS